MNFACAYWLRVIRITTSEQLSCVPTDNIVSRIATSFRRPHPILQ